LVHPVHEFHVTVNLTLSADIHGQCVYVNGQGDNKKPLTRSGIYGFNTEIDLEETEFEWIGFMWLTTETRGEQLKWQLKAVSLCLITHHATNMYGKVEV
jgi:hypothetical protein